MHPFLIPDDFRAFMTGAVKVIDSPSEDRFLDAEDALRHESSHGGRIDGIFTYRFHYVSPDRRERWVIVLEETQIRDIAYGLLIEVEAEREDATRSGLHVRSGDPVLVWGEFREDSLRSADAAELAVALDALHEAAFGAPRMLRIWSVADDQVVAVIWRNECALYVVEAAAGYATSVGDKTRNDSFELRDHEGAPLTVPWSDCVTWSVARAALIRFAEHGDLGARISIEGRIPSVLLMFGESDRASLIAARGEPPMTIVTSSLPKLAPEAIERAASCRDASPPDYAAWAERVVAALRMVELVVLADEDVATFIEYVTALLETNGDDASDAIQVADWMVREISMIPGVIETFATGADLRGVLRKTRDD